jgi:hypothetical protein
MRTKIFQEQTDVVVVEKNPITDEIETTTYFCPVNGGYVRIRDRDGRYPQVCDRLASTGSTLSSPTRDALISVIRREYRAYRRMMAREMAI